jgi:hypothetical protein
LPESVTEYLVQVNEPPFAIAPGLFVFWVTKAVAVDVQPLTGLVTLTIYAPGILTVGFCKVDAKLLGPDQL